MRFEEEERVILWLHLKRAGKEGGGGEYYYIVLVLGEDSLVIFAVL